MSKIDKSDIKNLSYEGYLWFSDKQRPEYIDKNNPFNSSKLEDHPFVVEGALYAKAENVSITIRCIDGQYFIHQFDGNKLLDEKQFRHIEHKWTVNKDEHGRKVLMHEIWQLKPDSLCESMSSFQPAFWIFKGFVQK